MSYPKWPSDLARKNQRIIAERLRWPEGILEACIDLEDRYPGWHVSWMAENVAPGFERPAGFWAQNDSVGMHAVEAFRTDLGDLEEVLAEGIPPHGYGLDKCPWCRAHVGPASARPVKL